MTSVGRASGRSTLLMTTIGFSPTFNALETKFVVSKALKVGLKPIVVINKVDKPDARVSEVVNEVFDLFAALDATDEQLDFPILYGSAKQGWMADSPDGPKENMAPLFDLVLKHVPPPKIEAGGFRMLGTLLEAN